jgi:hypothetical protein
MLGLIKFQNSIQKPRISKCIEEFNDYLRYNSGAYGIIYVFNRDNLKLEPTQACYYEKDTYNYYSNYFNSFT